MTHSQMFCGCSRPCASGVSAVVCAYNKAAEAGIAAAPIATLDFGAVWRFSDLRAHASMARKHGLRCRFLVSTLARARHGKLNVALAHASEDCKMTTRHAGDCWIALHAWTAQALAPPSAAGRLNRLTARTENPPPQRLTTSAPRT